jgi:hypothetical protein
MPKSIMIEHNINNLNNFIAGWFIDPIICDRLLIYHEQNSNKSDGKIGADEGTITNKDIKNSIDSVLETNSLIMTQYFTYLQPVVDKYIEKYPWCNEHTAWKVIQNANIQQYAPNGGFYKWHCERWNKLEPQTSRHLVFMTYLNDVTDGGETEFYHQKLKIKPEKGLTLIWPADWTFTHRGVPSPTQEKYIITGWFNYV